MALFYLVRHGETDWLMTRRLGLLGLQQDFVPLTARGEKEAERLRSDERLRGCEVLLSSPYTRALQTAAIANTELKLPLKVEFGLHETLPNVYREALSVDETLKLCEDFERNKGKAPENESIRWETLDQARSRVLNVLRKYEQYGTVAVVCHEKIIKSLTGWKDIPTASVSPFTFPKEKI